MFPSTPLILFVSGLLAGALIYPLVKLLVASSLFNILQACVSLVTAPFILIGRLLRKKVDLGKYFNSRSERRHSHEDQLKATSQALRTMLFSLSTIIQRTDQAANTSNQALGDVRKTIGMMDLPDDLTEVHRQLMQEIDRMVSGNSALKKELSRSQDDLASQRRQIEELRSAVRLDGLTQLANRAYFDEKLLEMIKTRRRGNDKFSLLLVDIDNFKTVNDKYGHPAGDRILKGVAFNLRSVLQENDFVARFGGDEFAIILFKSDRKSAAELALKLCHNQQESSFLMDGVNIKVSLSIGIAEADAKDTAESLLTRADQALYCVKSEGRNGVRCL